ncbi:winged helix-turn-helix transcriptional regulator [Streptomyces spiramyceticus]|uniref:winged helix-turn-helix transcriptional regulator n=1 Tax=Streptomyces spiramyceticus TaxID=299717 RepID=UPI00237A9D69|nr:helix-turn-helix domain-containing protein [Streptomyces spiramyceticus]
MNDAATPTPAPTPLPAGGPNAIAVAFGLLGDEWALLILWYAHQGVRRYQDGRGLLPISDAVLAARLARLTEERLLDRVAYQDRPVRYEYRLTRRGREIWPVLVAVRGWEYRWAGDHREPSARMRHSTCGRRMEPVMVCDGCGDPVQPRDIGSTLGPSGDDGRSIPSAATRRRSAAVPPEGAAGLRGVRWAACRAGPAGGGDAAAGVTQAPGGARAGSPGPPHGVRGGPGLTRLARFRPAVPLSRYPAECAARPGRLRTRPV